MAALSHGMRIVALCHFATLASYLHQHGALCPPLFSATDRPLTVSFDLSSQGHRALFALTAGIAAVLTLQPLARKTRGVSSSWVCWAHVAAWLVLYYIQRQAMLTCPQFVGNFGWQWQLAETSLLCAAAALPPRPSAANVWLFRWLAFRVMWGAGMSKLGTRSSACWRWPELSCTTTHYETQPLPSPLAFLLHRLPVPVHQAEVLVNHVAELVAPYLLWAPWPVVANAGAAVIIAYMGAIAASGSYATIQLITVAPVVASWQLTGAVGAGAHELASSVASAPAEDASGKSKAAPAGTVPAPLPRWRFVVDALLLALIAWRSIEPVRESLSTSPWLATYDSFYAVNSYGVFGFVNARRYGLGLSVSASCNLANGTVVRLAEGRPLDLPCLPGSPSRMPCLQALAPPGYHRMLDWDVWIHTTASLEGAVDNGRVGGDRPQPQRLLLVPPSLRRALTSLLAGDDDVAQALFEQPSARVALLGDTAAGEGGPCAGVAVDVAVRSVLHRFEFAEAVAEPLQSGRWWRRRRVPGVEPEVFPGRLLLPRAEAVSALGDLPGATVVRAWLRTRQPTVLLWAAAVMAAAVHASGLESGKRVRVGWAFGLGAAAAAAFVAAACA